MDTIPTKESYDGVTVPAPTTEVHSADEVNDRNVELEGTVTDSLQSLDAADGGQLSKANFANAVGAQSMNASGTNTVVLTPVTGANGFRVATPIIKTYDLLDGAIFNFQANATNIGNMTVNVGQTGALLIGAVPLFLEDGATEIPVGGVVAGRYYSVRYTSAGGGAFILISRSVWIPELYTGQESVTFPNGLIQKRGTTPSIGGNVTVEITYGTPFPGGFKASQVSYKGKSPSHQEIMQSQPKSGSEESILEVTNSFSASGVAYWFAEGW